MAGLLLILLSLSTTVLSLAENIKIDCGASESDLRSNKITSWVGDEGFVTTGKSFTIHGEKKPYKSLRSFPSGKSNCYSNIPATRRRKTLVRTVFYYGNYDGKSSPPSFSVIYDMKYIDNVTFTVSSPGDENPPAFISEVIFSPTRKSISVCLFRSSRQDVPFISSIEVYGMDVGMYDDIEPYEGLLLGKRFAFGAKETISDPYGRYWSPIGPNNPGSSEPTTSPSSIDTTGVPNKPPAIVMSKALLIKGTGTALPLSSSPLYLALYFSEPQNLDQTKKRSFNVFLDTKQQSSNPIVPVFRKATQFVIRDIVATSITQLNFESTSDSDLPPIVNAMEIYSILNAHGGGDRRGGQIGGGNGGEEQSGGDDDREGRRQKKAQADKAAGALAKIPAGGPRKPKLPLILGVTLGSAFAALSSVCAAISFKRGQNAKPESNTEPAMSTVSREEAGVAPLVGQQLASDVSHPGKDDHHQHGAA
ncbi:unnamed protein product [Eruca vesicaria subsp. sativa]|uniref:Malectin-like domain-containing protein n=1 Tax=Eruca vesicaria subsp. sativa TaxID=29727 RepID=A0ABC8M5T2_ERUVS|nr:unnamed protein product [Eruca vesicaria subsp. sativa]